MSDIKLDDVVNAPAFSIHLYLDFEVTLFCFFIVFFVPTVSG